jgi:hypothetical protein
MTLSIDLDPETGTELNKLKIFTQQPTSDKALVWLIKHWRSDLNTSKQLTKSYNELAERHNKILTELKLANSELRQLKGYVDPIYRCA